MTDAQIFTLLIAGLEAALPPGVLVAQGYQPSQQGAPSGPGVFLHKIGDVRRGSPHRSDRLNSDETEFVHTETQQMETAFQASVMVPQRPTDPTRMSAGDLVNAVAAIIASDRMIARLRAAGAGVLALPNISNPIVMNDHDENESEPIVDFTITHRRQLVDGVPILQSIDHAIHRV